MQMDWKDLLDDISDVVKEAGEKIDAKAKDNNIDLSRLKQLHQHLRQHHLLTTQRTKRVQTQTIKYQKKTEQLHYVETQSFFYGRKNLKFKFCLHYHHIQIEVDDSVHSCLQIRSHQLNLQESYLH